MVLGNFMQADQEGEAMSPPKTFNLPKGESSVSMISFELASTASTDTDSSLSVGGEEEQHHATRLSDLEAPFGILRHRTAEVTTEHSRDDVSAIDSDSEHGLVPRRRRKSNANLKRYLFYALAVIGGVTSIVSIQSLRIVPADDSPEWTHFKAHTVPMVRKELKRYQPEDHYTILLRGQRLDLLQQSVDRFSRCSSVKEVQVDFSGEGEIPITLLSHESRKVYPVSPTVPTSAVFLLSEGVIISCREMEKGLYE
jgi:hypothetical protein